MQNLKPVYLVYGSERLLLLEALERLRSRFAEDPNFEFNYDRLAGPDTSVAEIAVRADTLPFASERRLLVVDDVDCMPASEQAELADYIARAPDETCLVLVAAKIAKNSRLAKAVDKRGQISEYAPPRDYAAWITGRFKERGVQVSADAARFLSWAAGSDLMRLAKEIDKVCLYHKGRASLEREDLEGIVAVSPEANIFELGDALAAGEEARALVILDRLLAVGENELKILAMILRHYRLLLRAKGAIERGYRGSELQAALSGKGGKPLSSYVAGIYRRQSESLSAERLKSALRLVFQTEKAIKSGEVAPRLGLETLVVELGR